MTKSRSFCYVPIIFLLLQTFSFIQLVQKESINCARRTESFSDQRTPPTRNIPRLSTSHIPPLWKDGLAEMVHVVDLPKHTNISREKRIIYFLHIHKSAGHTICAAARVNNMRTSVYNCNVQRNQRCCGDGDSLNAQQAFAKHTSLTFVANERDMYEAMDLQHYRYVVVLRTSKSRYHSHWRHAFRANTTNEDFYSWSNRQPDNWNVRKICGTRCMSTPKYRITREQWDYTLARLLQFSDILFVENFRESFETFAEQVGWTKMPAVSFDHHDESPSGYPSLRGNWDSYMTTLDDVLYGLAVQRYGGYQEPSLSADEDRLLDQYFQYGKRQACMNPCCSSACSSY